MKNLKVWQKLLMLGAVLMAPFAVVTFEMLRSINGLGVEFARQELRGLDYYAPLSKLLQDVQAHQALAAAALSGDASFTDKLAAKRAEIEADVKNVDAADERLDSALGTSRKWAPIAAITRDLIHRAPGMTAQESFERHARLSDQLIALIGEVGDASKLTLDPDIDTYYLMNAVIFQGPEIAGLLAQGRAVAVAGAASHAIAADAQEQLLRQSVLASSLHDKIEQSFAKAIDFNADLRPALEQRVKHSEEGVEQAGGALKKLSTLRKAEQDAAATYATFTSEIDPLFTLQTAASGSLADLLDKRISHFRNEELSTLAEAAIGLAIVCLIGVFFMRDITGSLRQVVTVANRIAIGEIDVAATMQVIHNVIEEWVREHPEQWLWLHRRWPD